MEEWKKVWSKSYLEELQKFLTFKNSGRRGLKLGSVVLISDHLNKITKFPALGQVVEILSPRTFKLKYVKKEAVYDKDWKITRPAKTAVLVRPIQNLIWLCDPEETTFATLDPFTPTDDPDNVEVVARNETDDEPDQEGDPPVDNGPEENEVLPGDDNSNEVDTRAEPTDENPDDPADEESVSNEETPELPPVGRRPRKKIQRYGLD